MAIPTADIPETTIPAGPPGVATPLSVNAMRLNARHWAAAGAVVIGCALGIPVAWTHIERFETGPDYRIPYALSKDYWLYQRRLEQTIPADSIPVLGDSVIWGEYVRPDGTLTHFLNQGSGQPERFVNCGVNGLFPLAMEGLVEYYGGSLRDRKLIVHCNVLWMSSPRADLSSKREQDFNHAPLVPQFSPRIPCYRADASNRLGAAIGREVGFFGWIDHLNNAYFNQRSIPLWTLEEDEGSVPPQYSNAWRNPLAQITWRVPSDVADDPERGPASPRHKPWNAGHAAPVRFEWVPLEASLQWQAFQRIVRCLRDRGNDVLVILGPFNEAMVAQSQRPTFRQLRDKIAIWLVDNHVAHVVPDTLPSELYADASHPLTEGYAKLGKQLLKSTAFRDLLASRQRKIDLAGKAEITDFPAK